MRQYEMGTSKKQISVSSASGSSLVGVMVAVGISTLVALSIGSSLLAMVRVQNRVNAESTRLALVNLIRFNAQNIQTLYQSIIQSQSAGAIQLGQCVCGNTCGATASNPQPLVLVDVTNTPVANGTSPVKYGKYGESCQGSDCYFETIAYFQCVGSNCGTTTATSGNPMIRVHFEVKVLPSAKTTNKELTALRDITGPDIDVSLDTVKALASSNSFCAPSGSGSGGSPSISPCTFSSYWEYAYNGHGKVGRPISGGVLVSGPQRSSAVFPPNGVSFPPGITWSGGYGSDLILSGTPTSAGNYGGTFQGTCLDVNGQVQTYIISLLMQVDP